MANFANFYEADQFGNVVALSTPFDGVTGNVLLGNAFANSLYGESGAVVNYMLGQGGNDFLYGGYQGAINGMYGGDGIDTAFVATAPAGATLTINYTGGMMVQRNDGGTDFIGSDVEKVVFSNDAALIGIYAGTDSVVSDTWVQWNPGLDLAISFDWVDALYAGRISLDVANYDGDAFLDTAFIGATGVNTYVLLDYDFNAHTQSIVGVFGDGVLYELG